MRSEAYELLGRVEARHWWYRSLRRAAAREVAGCGRILDVGCGTGGMAEHLEGAEVFGLDLSPLALEIAAQKGRGKTLVRGDCVRLPFAAESFDAALCLDLLYHEWVEDEVGALWEINRVLKPGGTAVVQLPAFDRYLRDHDRSVMGQRRYTAGKLEGLFHEGGFAVVKLGYRNLPALCLVEASLHLGRLSPETGLRPLPSPLNLLLDLAMCAEEAITFRTPLPLGLSVWGVARKPGQ